MANKKTSSASDREAEQQPQVAPVEAQGSSSNAAISSPPAPPFASPVLPLLVHVSFENDEADISVLLLSLLPGRFSSHKRQSSHGRPSSPPPTSASPNKSSTANLAASLLRARTTKSNSPSSSRDPVAAQIAQLFSIVGRLSAENRAQQTHIVQFSSENEELRRKQEEHTRITDVISVASLDRAHWSWEAGAPGRQGRHVWAMERHRDSSSQKKNEDASLESLPLELFQSILSLLDHADHLALRVVSFKLLKLTSTVGYTRAKLLDSGKAAAFVGARTSKLSPSSARVSVLLAPHRIILTATNFDAAHLSSLLADDPPFALLRISIYLTPSVTLADWAPLLLLLDPEKVVVTGPKPSWRDDPTSRRFAEDELPFLPRWTRLRVFQAAGSSSIPLFSDGTLAASSCVKRCYPEKPVSFILRTFFADGKHQKREEVKEGELSTVLAREIAPDPTRESVTFIVCGEVGRRKKV